MNPNEQTLTVYERYFDRYVDGTRGEIVSGGSQGGWIRDIVSCLTLPAVALEIGSGHGRDARYLTELGVRVQTSDATNAAVEYLKANGFPETTKLNILKSEIAGKYDLIFAAAVFLHFTEPEFKEALRKIKPHLKKNGILAFSVKQGQGESWQDHKMGQPRYFKLYQSPEIKAILKQEEYVLLDERELENGKWLHFMARIQNGD